MERERRRAPPKAAVTVGRREAKDEDARAHEEGRGKDEEGEGGPERARAHPRPRPPHRPRGNNERPTLQRSAVAGGRKEENDEAAATKENEQKEAEEARDAAPEDGTSPANAEPSARREQSRSR
jgi:hypothetical protein